MNIEDILQQPGVWRGREIARNTGLAHIATGHSELDRLLPGGGWPLGALTELYHTQPGIGELRLLMPALARLSRQGRWLAIIAPPYIPYAPALAAYGLDLSRVLLVHPKTSVDGLWALEQGLRSGTCGAVIAWPRQADLPALRRLQLAAETGRSWGILFRDLACQAQASPAALRLRLEAVDDATRLYVFKCRGGNAGTELTLDLNQPTAAVSAPTQQPRSSPPQTFPKQRAVHRPHRRRSSSQGQPPQLDLPLVNTPGKHGPLSQSKPKPQRRRWRK